MVQGTVRDTSLRPWESLTQACIAEQVCCWCGGRVWQELVMKGKRVGQTCSSDVLSRTNACSSRPAQMDRCMRCKVTACDFICTAKRRAVETVYVLVPCRH